MLDTKSLLILEIMKSVILKSDSRERHVKERNRDDFYLSRHFVWLKKINCEPYFVKSIIRVVGNLLQGCLFSCFSLFFLTNRLLVLCYVSRSIRVNLPLLHFMKLLFRALGLVILTVLVLQYAVCFIYSAANSCWLALVILVLSYSVMLSVIFICYLISDSLEVLTAEWISDIESEPERW